MNTSAKTVLILLLISPLAWAEEGPRTGYFRISVTPLELLGPEGAKAVSSVFEPDEKLTWQLTVPDTYDHSKPAGAMVFVGWAEWGGGKRTWNTVLEEQNVIWIGAIGAGDKKSVNERMLKAILAKALLERDYRINPDRYYLFGYSGGAHIAAMLATSKPELFKGALFYAGALSWGKNTPTKIDLVRQNRFVFMAGSLDDNKRAIVRVSESYKKAGIRNTDFVLVPNVVRKMPGTGYFEQALAFLDGKSDSVEVAD